MTNTDIIFYINLALAFCAVTELTALSVMMKKTAFRYAVRLTAIFVLCFGLLAFIVQLFMYVLRNGFAMYGVYAAFGILIAGMLSTGVHDITISRRSNRALCITAGILCLVPPVGAIFTVILLFRMRFDTRAEGVVYNGYAYTFATLECCCGLFRPELIDGSDAEDFEPLEGKKRRALLKKLKKASKTAEGCFNYGEALVHYAPKKMKKAVKCISKAAKQNYPPALYNFGYFYEKGISVKRDIARAHEYYRRAAELGDHDAAIRLGISEIERGAHKEGYAVFEKHAADGDVCAKYDLAICRERGIAVDKDVADAVKQYHACLPLFAAQSRLFALAAESFRADGKKDEIFDMLGAYTYEGEFDTLMRGMFAVRDKLAADAADLFLAVVKQHGRWEGVARCLVGSLYIDCGALPKDRANGAEYIKSAIKLTPIARELYATVPKSVINPRSQSAKPVVKRSRQTAQKKPAEDANKKAPESESAEREIIDEAEKN